MKATLFNGYNLWFEETTIITEIFKGMAMNERISKKQKWFNKINLTCDDDLYIGIDVHRRSYHVALWLNDAPSHHLQPTDALPQHRENDRTYRPWIPLSPRAQSR